ncbi:GtrA family protein [uncultured Rhodoblastus sp.]|uniref:GtrA family protein n=1 Tax=uncultured Rhodoblastus sp. TaxID=543037 RepID=UPI0025FA7009|nr:GtrA family protein [uncultured Rhodoblastus sp.]
MTWRRQFATFFMVGLISTSVQYVILIGLKEASILPVVPATLVGYVIGGVVNYMLNRRHTFDSDRPHAEAGWRFAAVATVGFFITWGLMRLLVDNWGAPYIPAQIVTSILVMIWNFVANRLWTFATGVDAA